MLYAKIVKFYTIHKYYCILFSAIKYINPISYNVGVVGDVCEKGVAAAVIVHLAAIVLHTVAHDEIVNM